jgi:hypothetical protein
MVRACYDTHNSPRCDPSFVTLGIPKIKEDRHVACCLLAGNLLLGISAFQSLYDCLSGDCKSALSLLIDEADNLASLDWRLREARRKIKSLKRSHGSGVKLLVWLYYMTSDGLIWFGLRRYLLAPYLRKYCGGLYSTTGTPSTGC